MFDRKLNHDALDEHNRLRRLHGCPDLKLDESLANDAYEWAKYLANQEQLLYSSTTIYGENLALLTVSPRSKIPPQLSGRDITNTWYTEISAHNFQADQQPYSTHFTQVIWKDTRKLGLGWAASKGNQKIYVVARYKPAGNIRGQYAQNVPPVMAYSINSDNTNSRQFPEYYYSKPVEEQSKHIYNNYEHEQKITNTKSELPMYFVPNQAARAETQYYEPVQASIAQKRYNEPEQTPVVPDRYYEPTQQTYKIVYYDHKSLPNSPKLSTKSLNEPYYIEPVQTSIVQKRYNEPIATPAVSEPYYEPNYKSYQNLTTISNDDRRKITIVWDQDEPERRSNRHQVYRPIYRSEEQIYLRKRQPTYGFSRSLEKLPRGQRNKHYSSEWVEKYVYILPSNDYKRL